MKKEQEPKTFWEKYLRFWKKYGKIVVFTIFGIFAAALLLSLSDPEKKVKKDFGYNDFIKSAQEEEIEKIIIEIRDDAYLLKGKLVDVQSDKFLAKGEKFGFLIPKETEFENQKLIAYLNKHNIKFVVREKRNSPIGFTIFTLFFLIMAFFLLRSFGNPLKNQIKDQEKFIKKNNGFVSANTKQQIGPKVTFKDVAGLKEAKEELQEIIDFLKNPTQFSKLGGRVPRGVLLAGPTGSGKTLLARAVAGEAEAKFFSMSGSEFVEMFVGVGASRVRNLFSQARKEPPSIIFIDEIDAVARHRGAGLGGGHDEREQTLNQILVEMDGFDQREGIIVLAATNRPDMLDKAILRPGRFDRKVYTNLPDIEDREAILLVHARNKPLAKDVNLNIIARGTPGFSGADLENLLNEAALRAARQHKDTIAMNDMEWAKDKVLMGAEKKIIITTKEKLITAYHEIGHAITNLFCPRSDPLHKVSIIPRGQTLGITVQLPLKDKYLYSQKELEAKIVVFMGGKAAEELFLKKTTTGASNDIEIATTIARKMVCDFGMSDLGPLSFGRKEGEIFMGRDFVQTQDYSEETAKKIDEEVKKIVIEAHRKAREILEQNKKDVRKIVKLLFKKETLDGEEIKKLLNIESKTAN